jgi:hypothetical protein
MHPVFIVGHEKDNQLCGTCCGGFWAKKYFENKFIL